MSLSSLRSQMETSPHSFNESLEYRILLYEIAQELQTADYFVDVYDQVEERLKVLLHSERVLVFKRGRNQRELTTSSHRNGAKVRIDFSPNSLAGFVAMTQKPLRITDASHEETLRSIHPALKNDSKADRTLGVQTRATIVVPILHGEILIGVLQLINPDLSRFKRGEHQKLNLIASLLGDYFYEELGVTEGRFDLLIQKGIISRSELDDVTAQARRADSPVTTLLQSRLNVSRDALAESLSSFYQMPFSSTDINARVPANLIQDINPNFIRHQGWIPIAENGQEVTILIDDPTDIERISVIERVFRGHKIKLLLMFPEIIAEIAENALSENESEGDTIEELTDRASEEFINVIESASAKEHASEDQIGSNVVRLLNKLIVDAYKKGASDIHIQPSGTDKPANVLFRIEGSVRHIARIPFGLVRPVVSRIKVMCSLDLTERRLPQDGKCSIRFRGQSLELRVAVVPNAYGLETVVMRLLSNCEAMHLYGLNLNDSNLREVINLAEKPHGLFLVTGPTGSGKTTSLHAIVGHVNSGERIIWTIEDPVEITQPGLQQVSVNKHKGLTFANALRAFLRADPDVILVGEMRDEETAEIAVQASMTGHLVLSTLHTNSAAETISRLRSMHIDPFDLADSLLGILSQRLARTVCSNCAKDDPITDERREMLDDIIETNGLPALSGDFTVKVGNGCEICHGSGYKGRIGIHEMLVVTPTIREMIATRASTAEIVQQSRLDGLPSGIQDSLDKLIAGKIDFREFLKSQD